MSSLCTTLRAAKAPAFSAVPLPRPSRALATVTRAQQPQQQHNGQQHSATNAGGMERSQNGEGSTSPAVQRRSSNNNMARRGRRAGGDVLSPFFGGADLMPGFGRVGGLLRSLEDEMADMMTLFGQTGTGNPGSLLEGTSAEVTPFTVDVRESDNDITIVADAPGLRPEDIMVTVSPDKVLTMRAERKAEHEKQEGNVHRVERRYGSFVRSFKLPDNVDPEHVEAKVEHGELFVTVPKSKQTAQTDHVVQVK